MNKQTDKRRKRRRRKTRRLLKRLLRISIILIPIIILILLVTLIFGKDKDNSAKKETVETVAPIEIQKEEPEPITASILTGGDIIMHDPFLTSNYYLKEDGTFDYNK